MVIYKGNMQIELEEDLEKLKKEIKQLRNLKKEIFQSAKYHLLDGKTQMVDEKYDVGVRSRLEHSINVANISKRIIRRIYDLCSIPKISNTELFKLNKQRAALYVEIMAVSHDLGHTPFGHAGEAVINEFMQTISDKDTIKQIIENRKKYFGEEYEIQQGHTEEFEGCLSFEHNEQSVVEFYRIVEQSGIDLDEVDLERIINGILAHSISRVPEPPKDLFGQIVRQVDKIEYRNKDFDEEINYIKFDENEDIDLLRYKNLPSSQRIAQTVEDIANEAIQKGKISDDNDALKITRKLRDSYEKVIYLLDKDGKRGLLIGNNRERVQVMYRKLIEYYYTHTYKIPTKTLEYNYPINEERKSKRVLSFDKTKLDEQTDVELVISYLSTFTNEKCKVAYRRLVRERITKGKGYGIEPIKEEEIKERKEIQIEERISKMKAKDIYWGRESHTDSEYRTRVRLEDESFIQNNLVPKAVQVMQENREKHQKENEEDMKMYESMLEADKKRQEKENHQETPGGQEAPQGPEM